ncbi:hypothetical protein Emin_1483 [Elusimicrobium minutum Pei191]|uniref:Uncharacterized protein n=1 Tax=Elusimicrobium minutum (strain Pei191) TaxID=445932 RepID=B2KET5_ELUMP|nr:ankyrin repeat domain-containing protein [Elusimicrobium minutum]ACC99031.1 hypothetical protein Emin_1483 [Elusimicrobium minutum Pei191]
MFINLLKNITPVKIRALIGTAWVIPWVYLAVKGNSLVRDGYVLEYIEQGNIKKLYKFLTKKTKNKINKFYYKVVDVHTYERHTLLTAAIKADQIEIVKFLLGFPSIDINKKYVFSESSHNHREYTPLEYATKTHKPKIVQLLKDFSEGRRI